MIAAAPEHKPAHVLAEEARLRRANGGPMISKVQLPAAADNETREPDPLWDAVATHARGGAEPLAVVAFAHALLSDREEAIRADRLVRARGRLEEAVARRAREGAALDRDVPALAEITALAAAFETARVGEVLPRLPSAVADAFSLPPSAPTPWAVQGLELTSGRPMLLVGYAGSAKSLVTLAAARDMALGRKIWGSSDLRPSRPLRVLYLDLDFGPMTDSHVRRLIAHIGSDVAAVVAAARAERAAILGVADDGLPMLALGSHETHPDLVLQSVQPEEVARFRAAWTRAVAAYDVVVVDTLFAAKGSSINENATEGATPLLVWAEVSKRTGCAFWVLRHDGKAPETGAKASSQRGRGSSAVDGAAFSKFVLEVENPHDPPAEHRRRMTHAIARGGLPMDAFYLDIRGRDPDSLDVVYRTAEQEEQSHAADPGAKLEANVRRVVDAVRLAGAEGVFGKEALAKRANMKAVDCRSAIDTAIGRGLVKNAPRADRRPRYILGPTPPSAGF